MIKDHAWMMAYKDLHTELMQCADEGKDISGFDQKAALVTQIENEFDKEKRAVEIYNELQKLPVREDYKYDEPSDIEGILACRPLQVPRDIIRLPDAELYDKIYGAWLARCAGCLLGQPIEGWNSKRIQGLLNDTGNFPVKNYISSDIGEELREKYNIIDNGRVYGSNKINWINNITCSPEDDDTNYTVLGLKIVSEYGHDFTSENVAEAWLNFLPLLRTCTAERVAYKNIAACIEPPRSATHANPFREWIGAQIRADFFGYINPYDQEKAAHMAYCDAAISHIKNGIYGEMLFAAVISAAFTAGSLSEAFFVGLQQIPKGSRLYEAINDVLSWYDSGLTYNETIEKIKSRFDESIGHHWCHTISNAMIVCAAVLFGEGDIDKTFGYAISPGFDTDCNAATAGSILGAHFGAKKLPDKWILPLNDSLISGVDGFGKVLISELAKQTLAFVK